MLNGADLFGGREDSVADNTLWPIIDTVPQVRQWISRDQQVTDEVKGALYGLSCSGESDLQWRPASQSGS